jgi:pilus assembly protein FimV
MNEKDPLAVSRGVKLIQLLGASTLIALLSTQSVYAADGSSPFLGIPGWVWLLLVLAILIGVTLLPKKWIEPPKIKKMDVKPSKPTPVVKAPVVKAPVSVVKPQAPKIEVAPVIAPTPVVKAAPPVVPTPALKTAPPVSPIAVTPPQAKIQPETQPKKPVEPDALDEAKQLLAQQRFPQAVGILNKGLLKDPSRSDLMLALLEIYLKQGDHEAFDAQFEQLKQLDDPFALFQAEELHQQLERPAIVEDSDVIEYDASKAIFPEPEPETATPAHDYAADSLDFLSAKVQSDDFVPEMEKVAAEPEPVAITPIEHEFLLDDLDLKAPETDLQESAEQLSAKSDLNDFDFSTFDLTVPEVPKSKVGETAPVVAKVETPATPAIEPEAKSSTFIDTTPPVDLDFNFDDSFALDEDKPEVTKSEKSSWSTDLTNERFTPPTAPAAETTLGDIIKGDDLSSLEEEFPFLQSVDTFQTRLELARNYITLGEIDSARELLNEVSEQGGSAQQTEARELIAKLAS